MPTPKEGALELALISGGTITTRPRPLPPGARLTLGRADDNDVCVDDPAVSRRHCVLHGGPPIEVEDLGGANGTQLRPAAGRGDANATLNLRRLSGERSALCVGDALIIGGVVAVIRRADPPTPAGELGDEVVVIDPATRDVYDQAARAARSAISILVLGETGVGKDVLARAIHRLSPRAKRPFLALNCAALSESLLESELFGHEKGAFTGALQARPGLLESADGGTVFLDEIGDLPPTVQVKLLRVIEQREVLRVGARTPRAIDVRFVSATHRDLEALAARGDFRQALFFRLNGISLTLPPLRARSVEVAELARRMLASSARQVDRSLVPSLSPAALAALTAYHGPGNVRELRNAIERAVVLAEGREILPEHLPPRIAAAAGRPAPAPPPDLDALERVRCEWKAAERQRVLDALARCDGNQTKAAELLGVSRRTLVYRLDEYGIDRPRKRQE